MPATFPRTTFSLFMPVTLQDLGWNDHFQRAFDAVAKPGWMPGRLIRETKSTSLLFWTAGKMWTPSSAANSGMMRPRMRNCPLLETGWRLIREKRETKPSYAPFSRARPVFPQSSREKQRGTGIGNQCGYCGRSDGTGNGFQPQAHGALLYTHPPQRSISSHPA